ncbi:AEC family transporter [Bacillus carboniphilus]|uniref:AEC family transporter n=1 Tax=Bacillus carboniphilus TaxID=86663 RepID=A0ABP3FHC6_9BACI
MILIDVVIPVMAIFVIGFVVQKIFDFDIRSISTLSLYVLTPFLVFETFSTNELSWEYVHIVLFCICFCLILLSLSFLYGKIRKTNKTVTTAFMLAATFMNAGNYGAPLIYFALGERAFSYAIIVMVVQSILMNSIGLFLAANGSSMRAEEDFSPWKKMATMPVLYALILGISFQIFHLRVPGFLEQPVAMLSDACIPLIMLALGMQLAKIQFKSVNWYELSVITLARMVISPLVAVVVLSFVTLDPLLEKVFIIVASMPTAANITLLAIQFKTEPDFVSAVTFMTTLLSMVTIPIVLVFLGV